MNRILIVLFLLLPYAHEVYAQQDSPQGVYLGLQGGFGYGLYRDFGASPLTYRGLELTPGLSVNVERTHWRFKAALGLQGGGYGYRVGLSSMHAYGGQLALDFEALHLLHHSGRWQLWAGSSVGDRGDIRYNTSLGNAGVGFANFVNLNLIGRVEMTLGRWKLHGQMALTPASLLLRPGFAYMDNYDRDISNPVANFLDQYHFYLSAFTAISTDLGIALMLNNGNRLGLSYAWHYMTSRATETPAAPFRFEQAGHALLFQLDFKI